MIEVLAQLPELPESVENALNAAAEAALAYEGAEGDITILVVDDQAIHTMNREYRGIDRPTDVLSFPAAEGEAVLAIPDGFLGDIAISLPRAEAQAEEYGHSLLRELSFLAVHGFYHLLGYDHMTKEEEEVMFSKQEEVLHECNIER